MRLQQARPMTPEELQERAAPPSAADPEPHSLHDPEHVYKCAVPWCPKYVGIDASSTDKEPAT